jgi:hypothetical protein
MKQKQPGVNSRAELVYSPRAYAYVGSGTREYLAILYLKFKLSNEKTSFVPRDNVIFYGISLKLMISRCSVRYYNIPRSIHRGIL